MFECESIVIPYVNTCSFSVYNALYMYINKCFVCYDHENRSVDSETARIDMIACCRDWKFIA